jgi:type I restriction enzyme S subunit
LNALPVRKLKYAAFQVANKKPFEPSNGPYVGLEHIRSWTGAIDTQSEEVPDGTVSLFEAGDILFGKLRPYLAKVTLAPFSGAASTEALVLRARNDVWAPYLRYVLVEKGFIDRVSASTFGAQMPRASWEFIGSQLIAMPDIPTQVAVADFLDRETARIDQLIQKKERMTGLVTERSKAILQSAVKGQDRGDGPMRDSGIDWIGAVPEHWTVPKLNQVARLATGHTPSRSEESYWIPEECTIPWFGLQDIGQIRREGRVYVSTTKENISPRGLANSAAELLPARTVILSRTASVGYPAIMEVPMATTQDFVNWVCGPRLRPKYLYYVLRAMRRELDRLMMGSTHQTIYMPDVRAFRTPLPPVSEQDEIIRCLDQSLAGERSLVRAVDASLERLRELRSALITAAVTGQIDVATWGKRGETNRRLDAIEHDLESKRDEATA